MTGELDLSSAGQLTCTVGELGAAPAVRLVLDLAGLTGWDSAGLAALILAQQQVSAHPDARMAVAGLSGHLTRRLRAAGLHGEFTLAQTVTEAVGMLAPPA